MKRFSVGIAGVGKLGNYHCNNLLQLENAELVGVYDIDRQRCQEIAAQYSCRAFETYEELLENAEIVGIVVPTIDHHKTAMQALHAGKHIFVEKPISSTVAEAEEMVRTAENYKLKIQIGHIERFNPAIRALDTNGLAPMFIESHRLAPFDPRGTDVAVVLDLMIHDIDIILSLVKGLPSRIDANGVAVVSDAVDIANARIQFDNGCVANVTASRISQRKMRKMRLFQKDSYISIDFLQRLTEVFEIDDADKAENSTVVLGQIDKGKHKKNIIYQRPRLPEEDAMQVEWKSFLTAIESDRTPIVSGQDGLNALKVAVEITNIISNSKLQD